MTILYPCRHDIKEDCPACMQDEIERLTNQLVKAKGEITKLAAECHRAKWQFDLSEDFLPTRRAGRALAVDAFNALHRIGDQAIKAKDALTDEVRADLSSGQRI